jgi:putative ABC transport system permease protein
MIFQNIKSSVKRLLYNKLYTIINVGGLSLSFAVAILMFLYVHNEITTDKYHSNLDNLYRLTENKNKSTDTPATFGEYIENKFPEIKCFTRYKEFNQVIQYNGDKSMKMDHIAYMDSSCLDMFTIHIVKSNQSKLLRTNQSALISETTAEKLFGGADPLGKTIRFENVHDYIIEGVFEDYPTNSSLQHNIIASFPSIKFFWGWPDYDILKEEGNWSVSTFVMLNEGVNKDNLDGRLQKDLAERFGRQTEFYLQEYSSIYFDNEISDEIRHGKTQVVYLFLSIAIIIIIIAMINYINLSTSISAKRALSIGIYKTLGAQRKNLIFQFMIETIMICLFSLILGYILAELFIPTFNNLLQYKLQVKSFYAFPFSVISIAIAILIGLISGIYPSMYLTRFSPLQILKGKVSGTKGIGLFKKALMVFQFIITISLITGTIVVYKQLNYWRTMDIGVNKDHVLVIRPSDDLQKSAKVFKEKIGKIAGVEDVSFSKGTVGMVGNGLYDVIDDQTINLRHLRVDANYFDMFGIEVIDGEGFSKNNPDINKGKYLLNEAAVTYLDWETAYEKDLWGWKCIGVIKDFNFASQQDAIAPLFISFTDKEVAWTINIKISSVNIPSTLKQIKEIWTELSPADPFEYQFIDDIFNKQYNNEERLTKLLGYFAIFSIFIACLGLFGLISFMAEQRTKEIGIRKTNGATIGHIILLFSKEFIQLILISGLIAIPLSYYMLMKWLQDFAYATKLSWWIFAISITIAIIVSSLSVFYRAYRAASQNPVDALRYE